MDRFREVLLDVWREACRHIEIPQSCAIIAPLLARHLPLGRLIVRRWDSHSAALDTVAVSPGAPADTTAAGRTPLAPAEQRRFARWGQSSELLHWPPSRDNPLLESIIPPQTEGKALAGPLHSPTGAAGTLVLVARPGHDFHEPHQAMVQSLLEPFSAALENDRRLHELAALREAAEADRRSLLSRLGRQEIAETIVGAESGLRHVMERVNLVAQSDVPVLILGETGTGKEVVARAVHNRAARSSGPFIRVNCGAIPPELIDSQLFGHEKGAFTGASDARAGWFERADGGTLFLDEIGELPLAAQVRLLRVLQDGFIERVGAHQSIHVDVRLIAATHRDLAAMVKAGTFREDLWYRINVFPVLLPRLRERTEDIPPLARHFALRAAIRFGLPPVEPTPADLHLLMSYPWPGNIRELGAVIDRAAILGNGERLDVARALGTPNSPSQVAPLDTAPTLYEVIPDAEPEGATAQFDSTPVLTLDAAMKVHIQKALVATSGRIEGPKGAAVLLGINPYTLRSRMRKLGLDWSRFRRH